MSCSLALFPGYKHTDQVAIRPEPWFTSDTGHYLYNTSIDLMKNHYSGLMVIKPTGRDTCRVIMITEVGLKVLDFEFFPMAEMKVHYIMEPLNRKMLIKTLSNDLSMILMNRIGQEDYKLLKNQDTGETVLRYRFGPRKYYYHLAESPYPVSVTQTKYIANKVHASFFGKSESGPDSIIIKHYNIALTINLKRIKETSHVDE